MSCAQERMKFVSDETGTNAFRTENSPKNEIKKRAENQAGVPNYVWLFDMGYWEELDKFLRKPVTLPPSRPPSTSSHTSSSSPSPPPPSPSTSSLTTPRPPTTPSLTFHSPPTTLLPTCPHHSSTSSHTSSSSPSPPPPSPSISSLTTPRPPTTLSLTPHSPPTTLLPTCPSHSSTLSPRPPSITTSSFSSPSPSPPSSLTTPSPATTWSFSPPSPPSTWSLTSTPPTVISLPPPSPPTTLLLTCTSPTSTLSLSPPSPSTTQPHTPPNPLSLDDGPLVYSVSSTGELIPLRSPDRTTLTNMTATSRNMKDQQLFHENKSCRENVIDESCPNLGNIVVENNNTKENIEDTDIAPRNPKGKRWYGRKNYCSFCKKLITNFRRHMINMHSNEEPVVRYNAVLDNDLKIRRLKRTKIFDELRKKHNFIYNQSILRESSTQPSISMLLPVRRPKRTAKDGPIEKYVICKSCSGYFSRKFFYKHSKVCQMNEHSIQEDGENSKEIALAIKENGIECHSTYGPHVNSLMKEKISPLQCKDERSLDSFNKLNEVVQMSTIDPKLNSVSVESKPNTHVQGQVLDFNDVDGPHYDANKQNNDNDSSEIPEKIINEKTNKTRRKHMNKLRKNYCSFCKKLITNFRRHMIDLHSNEEPVVRYNAVLDNDLKTRRIKRAKIFDELRKKYNFIYNQSILQKSSIPPSVSKLLPVRRPKCSAKDGPIEKYAICKSCSGYFSRTFLHKHSKVCRMNERRIQEDGENSKDITLPIKENGIECYSTYGPHVNSLMKEKISPLQCKDERSLDSFNKLNEVVQMSTIDPKLNSVSVESKPNTHVQGQVLDFNDVDGPHYDANKQNNDNDSSEIPEKIINEKIDKTRRKHKRKNYCSFCKKLITNFRRHMINMHSSEEPVVRYNAVLDNDLKIRRVKRTKIFDELRKKHNFIYNQSILRESSTPPSISMLLPVRRPKLTAKDSFIENYVFCKSCSGCFNRKKFYNHSKVCRMNKHRIQEDGENSKELTLPIKENGIECHSTYGPHVNSLMKEKISPLQRKDERSLDSINKLNEVVQMSTIDPKLKSVSVESKPNTHVQGQVLDFNDVDGPHYDANKQNNDNDSSEIPEKIINEEIKIRRHHKKRKWSEEQKSIVIEAFQELIKCSKNPGIKLCKELIEKEPLLRGRTWTQLNVLIDNYNKEKISLPPQYRHLKAKSN